MKVTLAGLEGGDAVTCSRGVNLVPDATLEDALVGAKVYDVVVLPGGGPGAAALAASKQVPTAPATPDSPKVGELLKQQELEERLVAAVCAAPTALLAHGVFTGRRLTSYPAFRCLLLLL